jgi:hypothetical protein
LFVWFYSLPTQNMLLKQEKRFWLTTRATTIFVINLSIC